MAGPQPLSNATLSILRTTYFDDFNEDKQFYRILFRPSVAVQARELTQLQSVLQNQISQFAQNIYKDGAIVDGVGLGRVDVLPFVHVEDAFLSGNLVAITELSNTYVITNNTNSTALRARVLISKQGYLSNYPYTNRLYVDYTVTGKDASNNDVNAFANGDTVYIYSANQSMLATLNASNLLGSIKVITANSTTNATGKAFFATTTDGYIYQKGFFQKVEPQLALIKDFDQLTNGRSLGFVTVENIVTENQDSSLNDNASGSSNYKAPGAHRLKLTPTLIALDHDVAANTDGFFTIAKFDADTFTQVERGDNIYSKIGDSINKRTFEESGNYTVNAFRIEVSNTSADANVFSYDISPGLAYVEGQRVEFISTVQANTFRANTTSTDQNKLITANYGNFVYCKELVGAVDIQNLDEVAIYDGTFTAVSSRTGYSAGNTGSIVGYANIKTVVHYSGTKGHSDAQYYVYLFNIRMNKGKTFYDNAKSFKGDASFSGTTVYFVADIVLTTASKAVIQDSTTAPLLFDTKLSAIKTLTPNDTTFRYRKSFTQSLTANGTLTFNLSGGLTGAGKEQLYDTAAANYQIVLTSNSYSANVANSTAGAALVTLTSANATAVGGTGALFESQFTTGDMIRVSSSVGATPVLLTVTGVISNTLMTVTPTPNSSTASVSNTFQRYYPAGTVLPITSSMLSVNATANSFTVTSGIAFYGSAGGVGNTVVAQAPVSKTLAIQTTKTISRNRYVKIDCANNGPSNTVNITGPYSLGLPDVLKINGVYIGTAHAYSNTTTNYANSFILDNGQRDDEYNIATIRPKASATSLITATSTILVELDHFVSDTSAGIGYYSVDSYPISTDGISSNSTKISIAEIPVYKSALNGNYDLRNCIDFRPIKANTAVSNVTVSNATINPAAANANTWSISGFGQYLPEVDSQFEADFTYYLPRRDVIMFNKKGRLNILNGIPATNPTLPQNISEGYAIAETIVQPFPSLTFKESQSYNRSDLVTAVKLKSTKRFTMKDIGELEKRISRLEYYTTLNALEQAAKDVTVPDANGIDRFKNGIFAEPFNNFNIANVNDPEHNIGIDPSSSIARPAFKRHALDLAFSNTDSTGVIQKGPYVMLPYTEDKFASQPYATNYRTVAFNTWNWVGNVTLMPPSDFKNDEKIGVNINTVIDIAAPWAAFANSPFGQKWEETGSSSSNTVTDVVSETKVAGGTETVIKNTTTTTISGNQISLTVDSVNSNTTMNYLEDISFNAFMKNKLVAFYAYSLKPNSKLHCFFDNVLVDQYIAPGVLVNTSSSNGVYNTDKFNDPTVTITSDFGNTLVSNSIGGVAGVFAIPAGKFLSGSRTFTITNVDSMENGINAMITKGEATFTSSSLTVTRSVNTITTKNPILKVNGVPKNKVVVDTSGGKFYTPDPPPPPSEGGPNDGPCCFDPDAKVLMADGSYKRIADVIIGEKVIGHDGIINTVLATKTTTVGNRKMIKFKDHSFYSTDDHLFLTQNGWKTWRPDRLVDNNTDNSMFLEGENRHHPLDNDDMLVMYDNGTVYGAYADLGIEEVDFDADFVVHDLHLDGDLTYIIDGFVVHNCGSCCFDPKAKVLMGDGTHKRIADINIGDQVVGLKGIINTVTGIEAPVLANRKMYSFNDNWAFVSEEHPLMTSIGWGAFDPESWAVEDMFKNKLVKIQVGTKILKSDGSYETVESIEEHVIDKNYVIYNLLLDGDHTYVVEDYVVHNKCGESGSSDPVAQSFTLENNTGALQPKNSSFITSIGVFFKKKDPILGCDFFLVETSSGNPDITQVLGTAHLESSAISVSDDSSTETKFVFDHPVFLQSDKLYAFIVAPVASSPEYEIFYTETGFKDLITGKTVSQNPYIGDMFLSSNRSSWNVKSREDLKFNLYRAAFTPGATGTAVFTNESDEFLTITDLSYGGRPNVTIQLGDVVYTANSTGVANTAAGAPRGIVQDWDPVTGELMLDSVTGGFSNTVGSAYITIHRPVPFTNTTLTYSATSNSTLIASANVATIDNLNVNAFTPKLSIMAPVLTAIDMSYQGTYYDGSSYVKDSSGKNIQNETTNEFFDKTRIAMSRSKEITLNGGLKSSFLNVNLSTQSYYCSPVIDLTGQRSYAIENIINNDATNEETRYGNALTKYISKTIQLAEGQDSEDLRVYLTAFRPKGSDIKVYAKFKAADDPEQFETKMWTPLEYKMAGDLVYSTQNNIKDYKEYEFGLPNITATIQNFNGNTSVNTTNEFISFTTNAFPNNALVQYYAAATNTVITGLTNTNFYYVVSANSTALSLSETLGGANINITAVSSAGDTGHYLKGYVSDIAHTAYANPDNSNIVEYYNDAGSKYASYKYFAIKVVLLSEDKLNVPRIDDIRAISLMV